MGRHRAVSTEDTPLLAVFAGVGVARSVGRLQFAGAARAGAGRGGAGLSGAVTPQII